MARFFGKSPGKQSNTNKSSSNNYKDMKLTGSLESNLRMLKEIMIDDDTLNARYVENQANSNIKGYVLFFVGMIDNEIIHENIILPFVRNTMLDSGSVSLDTLKNQVILTQKAEKTSAVSKLIESIYNGDAIFLLEDASEALIVYSKGWKTRSIQEPDTERVLRGPREGLTESLLINLSMIRRRLKTPDLKIKMRVLGERSNTNICICYIKGVANDKVLDELNKRLNKIKIDGILDSGYIQEMIRDSYYTPFKTVGSTERPDIVAAKMLEGRIAVIVDGSPVALTLPHIFIEYFQANDDYYVNFYFASIGRMLRIMGFILTISVPAIYVAIVTYHQEIIPTPLVMNIAASRQGVPFPTIVEAFAMLLVFELLRETGLRMPMFMGQALSIVGALVIGTAAVDARFVSAPMVIVVAFTGITGLLITRMKGAILLLRAIFLAMAGVLGFYGYLFTLAGLLIHLSELRSFGIPYMYKLLFLHPGEDIKDTVIRAPWWLLKYRPGLIASDSLRNITKRGKKS